MLWTQIKKQTISEAGLLQCRYLAQLNLSEPGHQRKISYSLDQLELGITNPNSVTVNLLILLFDCVIYVIKNMLFINIFK